MENTFAIILAVLTLGAVVLMAKGCDDVGKYVANENTRKALYIDKNRCSVSGFYGRSGEHKIYSCANGVVIRERDI